MIKLNIFAEADENFFKILKKEYPIWFNIIVQNKGDFESIFHLNISKSDLKEKLNREKNTPNITFINFFNMHPGGVKLPKCEEETIKKIKSNPEKYLPNIINKFPQAIFFLKIDKNLAKNLRNKYGIVIFSIDSIEDDFMIGNFMKVWNANDTLSKKNDLKTGWKELFYGIKIPPINSLVISDPYLFKNTNRGEYYSYTNILEISDAILPKSLNIDFHFTLLFSSNEEKIPKIKEKIDLLKKEIRDLRKKITINFEIYFYKTIYLHKRMILSNYFFCWSDKGFSIFDINKKKKFRDLNDFHFVRLFDKFDKINHKGDNYFYASNLFLKEISNICESLNENDKYCDQELVKNRLFNSQRQ